MKTDKNSKSRSLNKLHAMRNRDMRTPPSNVDAEQFRLDVADLNTNEAVDRVKKSCDTQNAQKK